MLDDDDYADITPTSSVGDASQSGDDKTESSEGQSKPNPALVGTDIFLFCYWPY